MACALAKTLPGLFSAESTAVEFKKLQTVKEVVHTRHRRTGRSRNHQRDLPEQVDSRLRFGGLNIEIVPGTSQFRHDVVMGHARCRVATFLAWAAASACDALWLFSDKPDAIAKK